MPPFLAQAELLPGVSITVMLRPLKTVVSAWLWVVTDLALHLAWNARRPASFAQHTHLSIKLQYTAICYGDILAVISMQITTT